MSRKRILIFAASFLVGILVMGVIFVHAFASPPEGYHQGYSYGYSWLRGSGGNLVVPPSSLPQLCREISAGKYDGGMPPPPGPDPAASWVQGCVAGMYAAGYTAP
jgi:hypothetical protein